MEPSGASGQGVARSQEAVQNPEPTGYSRHPSASSPGHSAASRQWSYMLDGSPVVLLEPPLVLVLELPLELEVGDTGPVDVGSASPVEVDPVDVSGPGRGPGTGPHAVRRRRGARTTMVQLEVLRVFRARLRFTVPLNSDALALEVIIPAIIARMRGRHDTASEQHPSPLR